MGVVHLLRRRRERLPEELPRPHDEEEGLGDKKIIAWDHNRDLIYQRASTILADPKAAQYVWGIGYHWYEPWSGGDQMFDNVKLVHESFPNKNLIFTEGCNDAFKAEELTRLEIGRTVRTLDDQ